MECCKHWYSITKRNYSHEDFWDSIHCKPSLSWRYWSFRDCVTLQNSRSITEDLVVVLSILGPENDMVHCVTKSSEDVHIQVDANSDHSILKPWYTAFQPSMSKPSRIRLLIYSRPSKVANDLKDIFSRVWHSGSNVQAEPQLLLLLWNRYFHSRMIQNTYCVYERISDDYLPAHVDILQRKKRSR